MKKTTWADTHEEEVTSQMKRKMIYGEKIMISRMQFKDGFKVPKHHHENEQISHVISGTIRFLFGEDQDDEVDLNPGEFIVIPPNLPHSAIMVGDVEAIDYFAPPRKDWIDGTDDYLKQG